MKLHCFKQEALDFFRANVETNKMLYANPDNKWVEELYRKEFGESPFLTLEVRIPDFQLSETGETGTDQDAENIRILYTNLMSLTESQAAEERLWAGLAHSDFYHYVWQRWKTDQETSKETYIKNIISRYFFAGHALVRNTLAKYWWIGKHIYDKSHPEDPFWLIDTLSYNDMGTRVNDLYTNKISCNSVISQEFLKAVHSFEIRGIAISRKVFRALIQFLNGYGALHLLDLMDAESLNTLLVNQIQYFLDHGTRFDELDSDSNGSDPDNSGTYEEEDEI